MLNVILGHTDLALDLNQTIQATLEMLRRLIGEDIDLLWQPADTLWSVKIDPSQVDQILANLCVNAGDAIAKMGKITIETGMKTFDKAYCADHAGFVPGDFVLLAVSDNGCGMDQVTMANLFEPFYTTKGVGKGTGLGLSTVYGIVKQNNGFINVYSEPGKAGRLAAIYPKIKLLFMSGYTANVIAHQGVLDKGVQFIQKPFSMQDIAAKVHASL